MTVTVDAARFADPVDLAAHGPYRTPAGPLIRFTGRITDDPPFSAKPCRYHVYGGWFCPWSQRVAITRHLAGLTGVISMSYVDGARDARGWAFRMSTGPDPVNGFRFLREAYDASREDFDGHISVPALWDRQSAQVVSNDYRTIGIDLATRFRAFAGAAVDTYPEDRRDEIEALDGWIGPAVNRGAGAAAEPGPARDALLAAFERLDERLAGSRYLVGDTVTEADVRLWVTLVRYDAGPNARRTINPGLHVYPRLWAYARDLYRLPAFRVTTDFAAFTAPGATLPDWAG